MAGSFKSMVWDYYLPTDMHEASIKPVVSWLVVQIVFVGFQKPVPCL